MKIKNKLFTWENLIRLSIVIVLILFASRKYSIDSIVVGLLIIFGMAILGASIVRIYQESKGYIKTRKWELSRTKSIFFIFLIVFISMVFLLFLSDEMKKYSFLTVGVILLLLLIYDFLVKTFKKIF
ncbi:hypothetical protein [Sunxiuqinia elliptica]|uniref:Uncharacterized protein n=1 Tax=Sunxiuqinia elliptica TaxID=655355 RepID=A0A4R6GNZ6_9BACT|nr:hypothetical protein [Sunxiuqinia elliptica]TDN96737.1 hypothetical protein DET52_111107 [Sunxiuqinia elliptica]TDO55704.1 hypothetical protein DET65_4242 [Sunxiuqinia elliptica]